MASVSPFGRGRGRGMAPRWGRPTSMGSHHGMKSHNTVKPRMYSNTPDLENQPLGELLETFDESDWKEPIYRSSYPSSHEIAISSPEISDCRYVASYNWLNDKEPTIIMPGKPPRWTPLQLPQKFAEDSGEYYRDPNAAMFPECPIAPVVQIIMDNDKELDTANIDIMACGSTLGNLLRVVRGTGKPFRFCIEVVGDTVFFLRRENNPTETIKDVRGFGHTFPEAYTTWDREVKGSETSQRVIQYRFAGLQCMVRFECDGYFDDSTSGKDDKAPAKGKNADADDLADELKGANITSTRVCSKTYTIKKGGKVVPQSSIFDLKTRSARKVGGIDMDDVYPLLWIKQIPNFIVAYHNGFGTFNDIQIQKVDKGLEAWQEENKEAISCLGRLLNHLVAFAHNKRELLEVYYPGHGSLEIRRQHGKGVHALPTALAERWNKLSSKELEGDSDDDDDGVPSLGGVTISDDTDDDSEDSEKDYTACDIGCGYCGKCTY